MESFQGARMRAAHGRPTADRKVDPQNHSVAGLVGLSFLYFLTVTDPRDTHEIPTNRPTESLYCQHVPALVSVHLIGGRDRHLSKLQ